MEVWKAVEGFDNYQISNMGRIKNNDGLILKPLIVRGYYNVALYVGKKKHYRRYIHRLLAIAFIPNPDNLPVIDHINRKRLDNRLENLRWASHQDNCINKELHSSSGYDNIYLTHHNTYIIRFMRFKKQYQKSFKTLEKAIEARDLLIST